MNLALQMIGYAIGLPLHLMVINAMRREGYRKYPFLFLYVIADFVTTVVEIQPSLAYDGGNAAARRRWAQIYWIDEGIIQAIVFMLVLSLVYRASARLAPRRTILVLLVVAFLAISGISYAVHHDPTLNTGKWITPWVRDVNFSAAVLDLALWAMLIGSPKRDYQLLMISGALGIQFTAGAIAPALREISHSLWVPTAVLVMVANLTTLYILWQIFRVPGRGGKAARQ
jgi:hypothetical protein